MSDTTHVFEPNQVQPLRLQLALRNLDVVTAQRGQMETELRFHQLARIAAEAGVMLAQVEDAKLLQRQEE